MKQVLFAVLLLNVAYGQVTLPQVAPFKSKGVEIEGTYKPSGKFLDEFPKFLSNGFYSFNFDNSILETYQNYGKNYYAGLYKFSSLEYPVVQVNSQNDLSKFGNLVIQFTSDCDVENNFFSKVRLGMTHVNNAAEDLITSKTDIDYYRKVIKLNSDIEERYQIVDKTYKDGAIALLRRLNAQRFDLCDFGSLSYKEDFGHSTDLVLQFVFVQGNTWTQKKTANKFPSHALYKLLVKNNDGVVLNKYGQGIFFEGSGWELKLPAALLATASVAFENLLNQFLNDRKTIDYILNEKARNERERQGIKDYAKVAELRHAYDLIRTRKHQLIFDLYTINDNLDAIAQDNEIRGQTMLNRSAFDDNNIAGTVINAMNNNSMTTQLRSLIKRNQTKLNKLEQLALELSVEETNFFNKIGEYDSLLVYLNDILNLKEGDDLVLSSLLDRVGAKTVSTKFVFDRTTDKIRADFNPVLQRNLIAFVDKVKQEQQTYKSNDNAQSPSPLPQLKNEPAETFSGQSTQTYRLNFPQTSTMESKQPETMVVKDDVARNNTRKNASKNSGQIQVTTVRNKYCGSANDVVLYWINTTNQKLDAMLYYKRPNGQWSDARAINDMLPGKKYEVPACNAGDSYLIFYRVSGSNDVFPTRQQITDASNSQTVINSGN